MKSIWERRHNTHRAQVRCKAWVRSDSGAYRTAITVDVHDHGCQLWVGEALGKNALVDLCLKLDEGEPIGLRALVAWCRPDRDTRGFRVGLAFTGGVSVDLRRLKRWFHCQSLSLQQVV